MSFSPRVRRATGAAAWIAVVLPLGLVLLSLFRAPQTNWTVRIAAAAFGVLAAVRPDAALLVSTALVGFGIILSHLAGVPELRVTEALVVASLAGCAVRAAAPGGGSLRSALRARLSAPVVLFAVTAVASAIVWQRVAQFQTAYPVPYLRDLLSMAGREYFVDPGDFRVLTATAALLEGLGLYVAAAALCRTDATFFARGARMLAVGGTGLAVMSVVRLVEILLRNPGAIEAMRATSVGLRISPQIPDYIAAGSYFALCWLASLGLAMAVRRGRAGWLAAGVPMLAALYLTGSRSVLGAAFAGLLVLGWLAWRSRGRSFGAIPIAAAAGLAVMIAGYQWWTGRDVAGEMALDSLTVRGELIRAGIGVIGTRPLFGIGLDRFYLLAGAFASPELHRLWTGRMNPHNDFLRVGAELGLVGLGLFLWILIDAGRRIAEALRRDRDVRLAGLTGGLAAFLVTSLISNPLMVRDVSYAFWIALGLAAGASPAASSATAAASARVPPRASRAAWLRAAVPWLVAGVLVLSVPFRARQELAAVDPRGVSYGFSDWIVGADGIRFRSAGPRATFFVDANARVVEIPLAAGEGAARPAGVELRVDGRPANRLTVGSNWQRFRLLLEPRKDSPRHRIDLIVPAGAGPSATEPGDSSQPDPGVRVGEVTVLPAPPGR
jgi:O-antigen ligase